MKQPLNYLFLKLQAITLLVFGQKRAALARFDAMRRLAPSNRYVMEIGRASCRERVCLAV